jgi:mitochondrial inner membrane protease subunit 1
MSFFSSVRNIFTTLSRQISKNEDARFIAQLLQFGTFCYLIDEYVVHLSMTHGPSMMPTLNEMGDIVLVDKFSSRFLHPIERGDVVIANSMNKKEFTVCKRVIGLPGDEIQFSHWDYSVVVPDDHVWIEGDNPHDSIDSRYYGPVPISYIKGRVYARIWPLSQMKWISSDQPRPTSNTLYEALMLKDPILKQYALESIEERQRDREIIREFLNMRNEQLRYTASEVQRPNQLPLEQLHQEQRDSDS